MDEFIPDFEDPEDEFSGYYDDDGNKLNPELIIKPGLCLLCRNDDNPHERILCTLNRLGQVDDEGEFCCGAFKPKNGNDE